MSYGDNWLTLLFSDENWWNLVQMAGIVTSMTWEEKPRDGKFLLLFVSFLCDVFDLKGQTCQSFLYSQFYDTKFIKISKDPRTTFTFSW